MGLFEARDPQEDPLHAASAAAVFRQPAFKAEIDFGINAFRQECLDSIKSKDYVRAEVAHDLAVHLQQFYDLFERLHNYHVQTLKPNQDAQDESTS